MAYASTTACALAFKELKLQEKETNELYSYRIKNTRKILKNVNTKELQNCFRTADPEK
jgi:hypothetical protein